MTAATGDPLIWLAQRDAQITLERVRYTDVLKVSVSLRMPSGPPFTATSPVPAWALHTADDPRALLDDALRRCIGMLS